nr:tripartite tricarboxylate transporter substrate-binding protein [Verticiella sp. GG226]
MARRPAASPIWPACCSASRWASAGCPWATRGGSQVLTDLAGGQIDAALNSYLATYPLVKNGSVKMLAVASAERFTPIPQTPTVAEAVPDFVTGSWQGLFAPAGTPARVVDKIHADVARVLALPEVHQRLADLGSEAVDKTPAQFSTWMQEQADYWGKVVTDNNIQLM